MHTTADGAFATDHPGPRNLEIVLEAVSRTEEEILTHGELSPERTHSLEWPSATYGPIPNICRTAGGIEMRN
jgi:hypothetical protein